MLNELLYKKLRREFGIVKVANEGLPFIAKDERRPDCDKHELKVVQWGETYHVNCPFCIRVVGRPDTRFRLWINHRYGTKFNHASSIILDKLAICFNENCLSNEENRALLAAKLLTGVRNSTFVAPLPKLSKEPEIPQITLPDNLIELTSLPGDHPAITYLNRRKFNPGFLSEVYSVRYCFSPDPKYPLAYGRIIVPIYKEGILYSWQARRINEDNFEKKYHTCPNSKPSLTLYGIDVVPKNSEYVVLVEGVTDVWRVGINALASFGTNLSYEQALLLFSLSLPVVILWDGDATNKAKKLLERLRAISLKVPIYVAELPVDKDPADLSQEECLKVIYNTIRN